MQIADKNKGIGNCEKNVIKKQISDLMSVNQDSQDAENYYKIAVTFSANFQRKAIARTGNTSSGAKIDTDLRLFRVCTWQNMQGICLKFFDEKNPKVEGGDAEQEVRRKFLRANKTASLTATLNENSKKLNSMRGVVAGHSARPLGATPAVASREG